MVSTVLLCTKLSSSSNFEHIYRLLRIAMGLLSIVTRLLHSTQYRPLENLILLAHGRCKILLRGVASLRLQVGLISNEVGSNMHVNFQILRRFNKNNCKSWLRQKYPITSKLVMKILADTYWVEAPSLKFAIDFYRSLIVLICFFKLVVDYWKFDDQSLDINNLCQFFGLEEKGVYAEQNLRVSNAKFPLDLFNFLSARPYEDCSCTLLWSSG